MGYVLVHVQLFFMSLVNLWMCSRFFLKFFPHITCDSFYSLNQSSIHLDQLRNSQSLSNVPTMLVRKVSRVVFMCLTFFCCKFSLIFASSFIFMLISTICYFDRLNCMPLSKKLLFLSNIHDNSYIFESLSLEQDPESGDPGATTPGGTPQNNEKAVLARVWGSFDSKWVSLSKIPFFYVTHENLPSDTWNHF